MEWHDVSETELPHDGSVMEVLLENGCIHLACYANAAWREPRISASAASQDEARIVGKVVKWRPFIQSLALGQKPRSGTARKVWNTRVLVAVAK